jgi:hypothetical protein
MMILVCQKQIYYKKPVLNNWVLGENKVIDRYSCYKATTELVTENKYLKEIFRFPTCDSVDCPQIPTSFGPGGVWGNFLV